MIRYKKLQQAKHESELFVRNFVAGVDDGMIATVGLLAGVASGDGQRHVVILTGIVAILVEAFSSAVGTILSEHSVEEFQAHADVPLNKSIFGGVTMFISYVVAGLIPLLPYVFLEKQSALFTSVALTFLVLGIIAFGKARKFGIDSAKEVFENIVIAGMSIAIGLLVGYFVKV